MILVKSETKYTVLLVLEGLLLSFVLMWILYIKFFPTPDRIFAEVFDVNVRIDFNMVLNNQGGLPVDWQRMYEGKVSQNRILPYISAWEKEVPQAYRSDKSERFFGTIKNGLFMVSDRDPFHPGGRYYLAAYDIEKEIVFFWDSNP